MTKQEAAKIVRLTFENAFNREQYVRFVTNLCKSVDTAKNRVNNAGRIPLAFADHVESIERIGKYIDSENHELLLFVVQLKKKTGIQRARTMQRNFVAWYLKHDKNLKDGAIVAFVAPDEDDWRFSLIKMDYQFVATGDKTKVKEEFTPARRWSYLVGQNESTHTAQSRFVELLAKDAKPSFAELEQAFNIEKVTKEFFLEYRSLFLRVKDELDKVVKSDSAVKNDFESKSVNTVDFAKKLLGQIVFLYFLQKKGWFGVKKGGAWGSGSKQFMRELFEKKHRSYGNFFNDILEPLFYDALSRDRSDVDHWNDTFQCKIPFLNGGLFDAINGYDWAGCDIPLPNEIFSNNKKINEVDRGDGILDIFDRYNFTVCEDEPLEKEVAIDPELLGKAYEKFNAIRPDNYAEYRKALKSGKKGDESKFNKQFGVFYTPREIVHYMCQQSLIQYLVSACVNLPDAPSESDFDVLVSQGEHLVDYEAQVDKQQKETNTYKHKLPATIVKLASEIDKKLADIRVCDPAIGSGAFPVGMMSEIVKARTILWHCRGIASSKEGATAADQSPKIYQFKRQCIEESIYGVDIDPGAVEIAKLRLWLSLIVDEDDIKYIQPLPNLDYKIMQGNSLLEEFEGIKLIDEKFFEEENLAALKKQIIDKESELAQKDEEDRKLKNTGKHTTESRKKYMKEIKALDKKIKELKKSLNHSDQMQITDSEAEKVSRELRRLHHAFFEETSKKKKENLRQEIDGLTLQLIKETLKAQSKEKLLPMVEAIEQSNHRPYFLWKMHFNEVFREEGGFDVVIGNPPYGVSIKDDYRASILSELGKVPDFEIYYYFLEKAGRLLNADGCTTLIIPNTFLFNSFANQYRRGMLKACAVIEILDCSNFEIFETVTVRNAIILFKKGHSDFVGFRNTDDVHTFFELISRNRQRISNSSLLLNNNNWSLCFKLDQTVLTLVAKIKSISNTLIDYFPKLTQGLIAYDKYRGQDETIIASRAYHAKEKKSKTFKPWLWGEDITRYRVNWNGQEYIDYGNGIANPRKPQYFTQPRVLVREITNPSIFAGYTEQELYNDPAIINILGSKVIPLYCLLAILNSRLASFYHFNSAPKAIKGAFPKILVSDIKDFPIPPKLEEEKTQQEILPLVEKILGLTGSADYLENKTKREKVKELEHEIDQLVYKLYELTPEEIKIVEGAR